MHDAPLPDDPATILPLVEETARIDKRQVVTGRVRVRTWTETEERTLSDTLRTEHAEVERVRIDRELAPGEALPTLRHEADGTVVIPVFEEVLVVETRLVLREEVRLRITSALDPVAHAVTLRRSRVAVEREPVTPAPTATTHGDRHDDTHLDGDVR